MRHVHPAMEEGVSRGVWKRRQLLRLSEAQNHRCCYCGRPTWLGMSETPLDGRLRATVEHVVSKSSFRGIGLEGFDRWEAHSHEGNLACACKECNNSRGDAVSAEAFHAIRNDPGAWEIWCAMRGTRFTEVHPEMLVRIAAHCPEIGEPKDEAPRDRASRSGRSRRPQRAAKAA